MSRDEEYWLWENKSDYGIYPMTYEEDMTRLAVRSDAKFQEPRTFVEGMTQMDAEGVKAYLRYTRQTDFLVTLAAYFEECHEAGEDPDLMSIPAGRGAIALVSLYAKLCYKSLVLGKNANISRVRDIEDNVKGVIDSTHGSVLEHVTLNLVTTDCSRVMTHELVRHRVGTAFSQTSGRYCSIDELEMVLPPEMIGEGAICQRCQGGGYELDELGNKIHASSSGEQTICVACLGHRTLPALAEHSRHLEQDLLRRWQMALIPKDMACPSCEGQSHAGKECGKCNGSGRAPLDFGVKKRLTSSIRRWAPNGQVNEIGWTANLRTLRHLVELRTSPAAEWEIRVVFGEVAALLQERMPLALHGGKTGEAVDGVVVWTGLKV